MKKLLLTFTMTIAVLAIPSVNAKGGHSSTSHSGTSKPSKKSSVPGSHDGKYVGGSGSSHKGGTYHNPTTGNEERNRKAGVPK